VGGLVAIVYLEWVVSFSFFSFFFSVVLFFLTRSGKHLVDFLNIWLYTVRRVAEVMLVFALMWLHGVAWKDA
jgi:hypothetical protein